MVHRRELVTAGVTDVVARSASATMPCVQTQTAVCAVFGCMMVVHAAVQGPRQPPPPVAELYPRPAR